MSRVGVRGFRVGVHEPCTLHREPMKEGERVRGARLENKYFTEMCSGSEAGSYLGLIDFVYHSTLGLRVIKKKKRKGVSCRRPAVWVWGLGSGLWRIGALNHEL